MKHLIKIESTAHGVIGVRHAGRDQQYCEAGETVVLNWQPDAGWGLKEAYYKDAGGNVTPISLIPTKINGKDVVTFTMPNANIVVGGVFKRFVIEDWTGKGSAFSIVGSFPTDKLPILDGFKDAGKIAFDETQMAYVHWDGYGWATADGKPATPRYLKLTAVIDGEIGFVAFNDGYGLPAGYEEPKIEYSLDGGASWETYKVVVTDTIEQATIIHLDAGESVLFRGVNDTLAYYLEDDGDYIYFRTYMEGKFAASGDVTALLNGVGGDVALAASCYNGMFYGCTGLVEAPALPATTLAAGCYGSMFYGCTGLVEAPALPATTLAEYCYDSMFYVCTGLVEAPALPATTLAEYCYGSMFYGCTGISSHDVATLNDSQNTFQNNTSCASLTIHADTPPTIGNNTITGLKADCTIYVPSASVDAYKAKQYWSARAAYIQAKQ